MAALKRLVARTEARAAVHRLVNDMAEAIAGGMLGFGLVRAPRPPDEIIQTDPSPTHWTEGPR